MAYFRIEYFSNALRRTTSFEMLIPNDPRAEAAAEVEGKPIRTLFLLHGYTGNAGNWVPWGLPRRTRWTSCGPTWEPERR